MPLYLQAPLEPLLHGATVPQQPPEAQRAQSQSLQLSRDIAPCLGNTGTPVGALGSHRGCHGGTRGSSEWMPPCASVSPYLVAAIVKGEEEEGGGGVVPGAPLQLQLHVVPGTVIDFGLGQTQGGQTVPSLPGTSLHLPLAQL